MTTTDQMKAALEKLASVEEHRSALTFVNHCWKDHNEDVMVTFKATDPYRWINVCAACLAELVNEEPDDGWIAVDKPERPENGSPVWITRLIMGGIDVDVRAAIYDWHSDPEVVWASDRHRDIYFAGVIFWKPRESRPRPPAVALKGRP